MEEKTYVLSKVFLVTKKNLTVLQFSEKQKKLMTTLKFSNLPKFLLVQLHHAGEGELKPEGKK